MSSMIAGVADRFGVNGKEAKRFFKFLVVGGIGFVVDFGIFNLLITPLTVLLNEGTAVHNLLTSFGLSAEQVVTVVPTLASTISFIAAIVSNFIWNRYWTYPDSRSKSFRRQFAQFALVSFTGILIRVPIVAFTYRPFTSLVENIAPSLSEYAVRLGKNMALALSVLVVMFWNFFVNRYWTYSDVQ